MKVDLILIHSVIKISTTPITEYLNKHDTNFVYTVLICKQAYNVFYID